MIFCHFSTWTNPISDIFVPFYNPPKWSAFLENFLICCGHRNKFFGHTLKSSICAHHGCLWLIRISRSTRSFSVIRVEILSVKVPSLIVITFKLSWTWFYFEIINGFGYFITQGYDFDPVKNLKEVITWRHMHVIAYVIACFGPLKILDFVIELHFWSNFIRTVWNWTKSRI